MSRADDAAGLAKLQARLNDALAASLAAGEIPGGMMAGGWVFVGNVVTEGGGVAPLMLCADETRYDSVLGLLELARLNWRRAAAEWLADGE